MGSSIDAVYSEVMYGEVEDTRPNPVPYELPVTVKTASTYELEDRENGIELLEEEHFIRMATGATIASRMTINRPKLDQVVCV